MTLLKNIVYSGISKGLSIQQKRAVIITNYLSLILPTLILLLLVYRIFFTVNTIVSVYISGAFVFLIPFCLNRLRLIILSQILICIIPVCFLWYAFITAMHEEAVIEISMYDGLRAYLLAMGIIPYLIFDRSKPLLILVTIAPGLISVLFLDEIMALAGLGHTQHELGSIDYQLMSIRSLISYFLISSGCLVLQYIIYKDDQFNRQLINDLRVKNAALIESQKKLNSINQNLEDIVDQKTEKLKKKNQALIKYAHTNAHHVRGPIARILGLIQVYTLDGNTDLKWFFEKIKIETEEVDIIVKNISKELNDLEHDKELKS